jgi:hypothetical protein
MARLDKLLVSALVLAALASALGIARGQDHQTLACDPTLNNCGVNEPIKPPTISAEAKLAAWKSQALIVLAQVALQATKEYAELQKRQAELAEQGTVLQTACGKDYQVAWTPEDITCASKPTPKEPAK